jgi:TorA maturation chaperone TorD
MKTSTAISTVTHDPALAMARQSLYRFAALALADPRLGSWADLDALRGDAVLREAAALVRSLPEAQPPELARGELPLVNLDPAAVLARLPGSARALNTAYERTFGLLAAGNSPPYETEYIDGKLTFQRSHALADVNGFYSAFGMAISSRHPERPDHIVLELEFMAVLLGLERHTVTSDVARRAERKRVCHAAQARFLADHLAWWAPAFAKLLSREDTTGYYAAVAAFLAALIAAERALLDVARPSRHASPSRLEEPDACSGCQLSA